MRRAKPAHDKQILAFAKAMRSEPTNAERALWRILRGKRLDGFKFKHQQPIGRYIADFVCFERKLIVEADGGQHSESISDAARDAWLSVQGYRVFRFWNNEVLRAPEVVTDTLLHALNTPEYVQDWRARSSPAAAPSPSPSPARGEGDFGVFANSETVTSRTDILRQASTHATPSPLAGEGAGEGDGQTQRDGAPNARRHHP